MVLVTDDLTALPVVSHGAAGLAHLGLDRFVTAGGSGGGPHALAAAALLPERCLAAATIAGVAPLDAAGLYFLAGTGEENLEEFGRALRGRAALEPYLAREVTVWARRRWTPSSRCWAACFLRWTWRSPAATTPTCSPRHRERLRVRLHGWLDDDLAFTQPGDSTSQQSPSP
ncbi:MAG: alpha/beta hydrolase fold protein [Frankiales bacterium]|nr:alpha/beta hydrolase fold protein [Frankiales bacterium]